MPLTMPRPLVALLATMHALLTRVDTWACSKADWIDRNITVSLMVWALAPLARRRVNKYNESALEAARKVLNQIDWLAKPLIVLGGIGCLAAIMTPIASITLLVGSFTAIIVGGTIAHMDSHPWDTETLSRLMTQIWY